MRRFSYVLVPLLLLVALTFQPAGDVRSGPIVQRLGPESALVILHGPEGGPLRLRVRAADEPGGAWREFEDVGTSECARFAIDALSPATHYDYELFEEGEWRRGGRFRSAPLPGEGRVRFVAFGDSGDLPWWNFLLDGPLRLRPWAERLAGHRPLQWAIGRHAATLEPHFVLHLGDVVYPRGEWRHYGAAVFEPFAALFAMADVHATIGNHDAMTDGARPLLRAFAPEGREGADERRYYDFVHGPVHVFNVANYTVSFAPGSPQRAWFESRLRASTAPWKLLFMHVPVYSASRSQHARGTQELQQNLHPFLVRQGVRLVLSGHDHTYQRYRERDGVNYVIAGGGGKSLYEIAEDPGHARAAERYSFVAVEVDEDRLVLEARDRAGVVFDRMELTRRL